MASPMPHEVRAEHDADEGNEWTLLEGHLVLFSLAITLSLFSVRSEISSFVTFEYAVCGLIRSMVLVVPVLICLVCQITNIQPILVPAGPPPSVRVSQRQAEMHSPSKRDSAKRVAKGLFNVIGGAIRGSPEAGDSGSQTVEDLRGQIEALVVQKKTLMEMNRAREIEVYSAKKKAMEVENSPET